jgi:heme/copper-type cytochrome/quinol oxidase subunit 3
MWAVIATELMLFICMFGAYYYLGSNKDRWSIETPPKLLLAFILLAVLLSSSAVLRWGEVQLEAQRFTSARVALWFTVSMGLVFVAIQSYEYYDHWKRLTLSSDSYGSIFYSITTLHAAHVGVGLLLLAYVGILPSYVPGARSPHKPYQTVALYWHFVDAVWLLIVTLLYVLPHFQRMHHVQ